MARPFGVGGADRTDQGRDMLFGLAVSGGLLCWLKRAQRGQADLVAGWTIRLAMLPIIFDAGTAGIRVSSGRL